MTNEIKTRIILPYGTPEQIAAKYEGRQLSAGELVLVVNEEDGSFTLSTGDFTKKSTNLFSASPAFCSETSTYISSEVSSYTPPDINIVCSEISTNNRKGKLMIEAECVKLSNDLSGQPVTLTQQLCTVVNNLSVLSVVTVGTPPEEVSAAVGSLQWKINTISSEITALHISDNINSLKAQIANLSVSIDYNIQQLNNFVNSISSAISNNFATKQYVDSSISAAAANFATKSYVDQQIARALSNITQQNNIISG